MRAPTRRVNGVWEGACGPFGVGLSAGILNVQFTPMGRLLCGGTNRGWPVRGIKPFALERLEWTGKMPFELKSINITGDGFRITFTKPLDQTTGNNIKSYKIGAFTHNYHSGYGGPEVDLTDSVVESVELAASGLSATIVLRKLKIGYVHEFDLGALRDRNKGELLHHNAYYTVNEVPKG